MTRKLRSDGRGMFSLLLRRAFGCYRQSCIRTGGELRQRLRVDTIFQCLGPSLPTQTYIRLAFWSSPDSPGSPTGGIADGAHNAVLSGDSSCARATTALG